jgi:hypothetical protein
MAFETVQLSSEYPFERVCLQTPLVQPVLLYLVHLTPKAVEFTKNCSILQVKFPYSYWLTVSPDFHGTLLKNWKPVDQSE